MVRRSCTFCLKEYSAVFMETIGIRSLWNNTYVPKWKIYTKQLCAWL